MEVTSTAVLGSLFIALLAVATSSALPTEEDRLDEVDRSTDKRPKYMDTREDFDVFKESVYIAIQELTDEGKISPSVFTQDFETKNSQNIKKRMYMGICMRQSHNHFIPYPCMRSARK